MNKLSIRLGLAFFVFILLTESILFFFLYTGIVSERIANETANLLARGSNHRDVLEKDFTQETIKHVAMMEYEAETIVVITDANHALIDASNELSEGMQALIEQSKSLYFPHRGELLEDRWKTEPYVATISPIRINGEVKGFVYMFLNTSSIRNMIHQLSNQFMLIGLLSGVITMFLIFFLSKFIVAPLIEMKKVTEQIGKGNHAYKLNTKRDDELGDLACAIQLLSDDLERLKRDRNEFLSSISHDLRTPLTYLKGYADVAARANLSDEQRNEYLEIIKEEAENVALLVKDLFELAKMDENQFTIEKERVQLHLLLEKIQLKFLPVYQEKNISLLVKCDEKIHVWIDEDRFKQVINNLLDNALKHSSPNTKVTIEGKQLGQGLTSIIVADEGEGIPEDDLSRIWDRLYRVEKSRSRSTGGSGLGLAIVKKIVESHGGEITVRSTLGKGTIFTILLKASEMNT